MLEVTIQSQFFTIYVFPHPFTTSTVSTVGTSRWPSDPRGCWGRATECLWVAPRWSWCYCPILGGCNVSSVIWGHQLVMEYSTGWWLSLPLWKIMEWKSVGMMTFPTEWKNQSHVPNHQPAAYKVSYLRYVLVISGLSPCICWHINH